MKTNKPFESLLPPLSTEEFAALKADVRANGVRDAIILDDDGNVLDGHHRLKIEPEAPTRIVSNLTPAEKEAFVFRANMVRRNLSPDQKKEARKKMKATAKRLREEDAKKWTNAQVGISLGIDESTVRKWFTNNRKSPNSGKTANKTKPFPDARVKVNPKDKPAIAEAVKEGKSESQVAADVGVSQQTISNIVRGEEKKAKAKKERKEAAKAIKGNCGINHCDFREAVIKEESVSMIFTDPPYDKESASLYQDLATMAARVLVPGGWLLAYSGHAHLPEVLSAFANTKGLEYAWTFCILHTGGDLRFLKYKIRNGWKPIVAAYKPKLTIDWEWFRDVVSGGKEKDDHEWQQAESEAAYFIEKLCPEGGMVLDPFCGSGTSLAAAKKLKRKWRGYEIDADHVETARIKVGK